MRQDADIHPKGGDVYRYGLAAAGAAAGEGTPSGTLVLSPGETLDWSRYDGGVAGPDFDGDIDDASLWAGQSCTVVHDITPAAPIVADLVAEAEAALGQPSGPASSE